jgi:hypothetical protein
MFKNVAKKHRDGTQTVRVKQKRFFWIHIQKTFAFMIRLNRNVFLTVFHITFKPFGFYSLVWSTEEGGKYRGFFGILKHSKYTVLHAGPDETFLTLHLFGKWVEIPKSRRGILQRAKQQAQAIYGGAARVSMTIDRKVIITHADTGVRLLRES